MFNRWKKQDFFEASSVLKSQSLPFQAPPSSSPGVKDVPENPPPSVTVASLIRAINSGDRQVLREATTAELNITIHSENSIVMGMSEATELKKYLLVAATCWLSGGENASVSNRSARYAVYQRHSPTRSVQL